MNDERMNKAKPSLPLRAAAIGAWVGGMLCLLPSLESYRYRSFDISGIQAASLLPYLPFFMALCPFIIVLLLFVGSKSIPGQMMDLKNLSKRTVLQYLGMLVMSCLLVVLVMFVAQWEGPAVFAVVLAGAVLGALAFVLFADWVNAWRQSGFEHVLFRTIGGACAVLGLGLALALRLTSRGPLYTLFGIIALLVLMSIAAVLDRIPDSTEEQGSAQDVGSDMPATGSIAPRGPATYNQLKSLRGQYALILIGIVVVSCLLSVPAQLVIQYRGNVFLPAIVISILSALLCAVVTGIYAQKVGIPHPIIPALSALLPFVPWIALFTVVGYTPTRLKESEPVEDSRSITTKRPIGLLIGFCVGLLPVAVMALLSLVNPRYMGQIFLGPPIGANIPGLPIPCGWPILGMISLGVLLPPASLGLGFYSRLVRREWKLLLVFIVLLQCALPSALLVMLGPAAVQVYKQFFGGPY